MPKTIVTILEDVISLVVLRLFAKRKKGLISEGDFMSFCDIGIERALSIVSVRQNSKAFEDMMTGEIRTSIELIARKSCGKCHGSGVQGKQGARIVICGCLDMVHYKGDSVVPLGEQYSNQYFTSDVKGDFSKDSLGRKDTVLNIASAVSMLLV